MLTRSFCVFLGSAALAMLASCATASQESMPAEAQAVAPLQLTPCRPEGATRDFLCGAHSVPENRALRDGRRLTLNVVVIPARTLAPDAAPIFFLAGGPGQAATEGAADFDNGWETEFNDVVLVDVRGSAGDHRLDCPPPAEAGPQAYLDPPFSDRARFRNCITGLSAEYDLTQYTTRLAMQDIDEVRQALGYDTINLYGISYGSRATLTYIHYYGDHVRAALISGPAPLANRNPLYHARAAQRAIEQVASSCAADPACHAAFPDVLGDLDAVMAELSARPARVTLAHDDTETEVTLTAPAFFEGLRVMLYRSEGSRRAPYLLSRARQGDLAPFAQAAHASTRALDNALRMGLLLAVTCSEDLPRISEADIVEFTEGTYMADVRVRNQMAACEGLPRATLAPDFYDPYTSDVPLLVITGDLDPVTPPHWGDVAREGFANSRLILTPGGHGEGGACIDPITAGFIRTADLSSLDTTCVDTLTLPPFVLDAAGLEQQD
ncbi:MAG: alpha/beta fold hydrolase [Hyphomonadaceae bacterium]